MRQLSLRRRLQSSRSGSAEKWSSISIFDTVRVRCAGLLARLGKCPLHSESNRIAALPRIDAMGHKPTFGRAIQSDHCLLAHLAPRAGYRFCDRPQVFDKQVIPIIRPRRNGRMPFSAIKMQRLPNRLLAAHKSCAYCVCCVCHARSILSSSFSKLAPFYSGRLSGRDLLAGSLRSVI
jgi:hypothetical protein